MIQIDIRLVLSASYSRKKGLSYLGKLLQRSSSTPQSLSEHEHSCRRRYYLVYVGKTLATFWRLMAIQWWSTSLNLQPWKLSCRPRWYEGLSIVGSWLFFHTVLRSTRFPLRPPPPQPWYIGSVYSKEKPHTTFTGLDTRAPSRPMWGSTSSVGSKLTPRYFSPWGIQFDVQQRE